MTPTARSHRFLAVALAVLSLLAALACGDSPALTLVIRGADNRPVEGVRVLEAGSERDFGTTDRLGQITITPRRRKGEVLRVRFEVPARPDSLRLEQVLTLGDEDFQRGTRIIRASAAHPNEVAPGARALLHVETQPAGAEVRLNGDLAGITPLDLPDVAPGQADVRIHLEGYQDHAMELYLPAGRETRYSWQLAPKQFAPLDQPAAKPKAPLIRAATPEEQQVAPEPDPPRAEPEPPKREDTPPVTREPVPPPVDPRAADEAEIRLLLDRYAAALSALDVARYDALWVALSAESRRKLERAFSDLRSQRVELREITIRVTGREAEARFHESRRLVPRAGSGMAQERDPVMLLEKGADGRWRISALR